jgi:hypothetical protein
MPGFYKVLNSLGPHEAGEIVEITADHVKAGVDEARLKALGVIEKVAGHPEEATPIGETRNPDRNMGGIPLVPESAPPVVGKG